MQDYFNELIESYKNLPKDEKSNILIDELKELIVLYISIAETYKIDYEILKSKEILDIKEKQYNNDDYLEALYVYLNVLKNVTASIINNLIEKTQ